MKDNEKQISKIAEIIEDYSDIEQSYYDGEWQSVNVYSGLAKTLYNKGLRIVNEDNIVISKEEYERLKTQLRIKTNEADWRADQLQALDKDFEVLEKVVKCKNCKWSVEKHYEENGEEPYIKLVCMLTKRQCQLNDFCSYGEEKL